MIKQDSLTKQELEDLAQQYQECQLSLLQEKELEYVLSCVDISSPLLDETREMMGISTLLSAGEPLPSATNALFLVAAKRKRGWRTALKWSSIAACLGLAVLTGTKFLSSGASEDTDSQYYVLIYINGKDISSQKEAQKIADENYERNMALLANINAEVSAELRESIEMMNKLQ